MMSEKRFIVESVMIDCLCEDEPRIAKVITDTKETYSYEDLYEVAELLNEQDKEIGLLRLELDTHRHPLWSTREAERKVNKLSDSLADEVKKNGLLNEKINQLRIENMRLKKRW